MPQNSRTIILYGKPVCPMVTPARRTLEQADANFEYVDIYNDAEARARVREINDGYESVPTLVFPDGSTLTEPSTAELKATLKAMGYPVPSPAERKRLESVLENPLIGLAGLLLLAIGALNGELLLASVGVGILALELVSGRL